MTFDSRKKSLLRSLTDVLDKVGVTGYIEDYFDFKPRSLVVRRSFYIPTSQDHLV